MSPSILGPSPFVELDAFEADGWPTLGPTYGPFVGRITRRLVDALLDAAEVGPGIRVLDVATGPGYTASRAAERGASVVGVDHAPAMIQLARKLNPDLEFRRAGPDELPFADGAFDAVVSNFVVPHLGRPERGVADMVRVLRPGGHLALTTWDLPERARLFRVFLDAIDAAGATLPDNVPAGPEFFRFAVEEAFGALVAGAGLVDVSVTTIAFTHEVATADELWDGMLTGSVCLSALVVGHPEPTRRRIRAAFNELVVEYRCGDAFELPISVRLARGRKPGTS